MTTTGTDAEWERIFGRGPVADLSDGGRIIPESVRIAYGWEPITADPLTVDEEPFDERGEWDDALRGAWLGAVLLLMAFVAGVVVGRVLP